MADAFKLSMPVWEIATRTSLVYLAIVILLRLTPKRRSGTISPNDIIGLVLIGALSGDAIMGGSTSIGDILLMIAVIVGWGYLIDALEYSVPSVRRLIREEERTLIQDGKIL